MTKKQKKILIRNTLAFISLAIVYGTMFALYFMR